MSSRQECRGAIRRLAPVALMPPAALLVHQLRYMLAFGGRAGAVLAQQGHAYLHSVVPWLVLLIALAAGGFLWALGRAVAGQKSLARYTISFTALWLACSACLIAIYIGQELLEGALATGHPPGLEGVFGYGGWWAVPVAVCVGLVLAAVFHGARWVIEAVARRSERQLTHRASPIRLAAGFEAVVPRLAPVAGGWSSRGPPS